MKCHFRVADVWRGVCIDDTSGLDQEQDSIHAGMYEKQTEYFNQIYELLGRV